MNACAIEIDRFIKSFLFVLLFFSAGIAQAQLYWRADLGYSIAADANIKDKDFGAFGLICGDAACDTGGEINDIGEAAVLSAGVGWRFTPNLRADVTIAYRDGYKFNEASAFPDVAYKADITSVNVMVNGYYDFTLGWGKPYIGAGVGWASNKVKDFVTTIGASDLSVPGGTASDFAWALMAGIGIPLSANLILDVGYRYMDLGKIETDSGNITFGNIVFIPPYPGASGKLQAHELMIGLRF